MSPFKKFLKYFQSKSPRSLGDVKHSQARPYRPPRVPLKALHNVTFARQIPPTADLTPLANLSSQGIGFFKIPGQVWPAPGEIIKGELRIGHQGFSVAARVVHEASLVVGCVFILAPSNLKPAIESYFAAEISALSLSEVNREILKPEPDGEPRWYRGKGTAELYTVEDRGKIQRFSLSFLGTYVEGGAGIEPRFSFIVGEDPTLDEETNAKYSSSHLIRPTTNPTSDMVQAALRFIGSISALTESQKAMLNFYIQGVQQDDE